MVAGAVDTGGANGEALRAGVGAQVRANRDVSLFATATGTGAVGDGGSITAGAISAGRDIAIHSVDKNVATGTLAAGDDIAIRAIAGSVNISGDARTGRPVTRTQGRRLHR